MFVLVCVLIILFCIGFCYLLYRVLEMEKDIETLYQSYSKELEKVVEVNIELNKRSSV